MLINQGLPVCIGTVNNIIVGGNDFKINVTSPNSGATTNTQRIDILGYYL
jgi:hypothetical protein